MWHAMNGRQPEAAVCRRCILPRNGTQGRGILHRIRAVQSSAPVLHRAAIASPPGMRPTAHEPVAPALQLPMPTRQGASLPPLSAFLFVCRDQRFRASLTPYMVPRVVRIPNSQPPPAGNPPPNLRPAPGPPPRCGPGWLPLPQLRSPAAAPPPPRQSLPPSPPPAAQAHPPPQPRPTHTRCCCYCCHRSCLPASAPPCCPHPRPRPTP